MSKFKDGTLAIEEVFGIDCNAFIENVLSDERDNSMVEKVENRLRAYKPLNNDENILKINDIIEKISTERSITRVDDLVSIFNIEKRRLQRLFKTYVGIGPKWVIKKYRLHEIIEKIDNGDVDWQQMITDLGYYDQSHFIKDFRTFIGKSPSQYLNKA